MNRSLCLVPALCALLFSSTIAAAQNTGWREFAPSGEVVVQVPSDITTDTIPITSTTNARVHAAAVEGCTVMVVTMSLPGKPPPPNAALTTLQANFIPGLARGMSKWGGTPSIVDGGSVTLDGCPGREARIEVDVAGTRVFGVFRTYLVKSTVVIVGTYWTSDETAAVSRYFLSTARLAGRPRALPSPPPLPAVAGTVADTQASASATAWRTVASDEGRFSIDFPGTPTETVSDIPAETGPVPMHKLERKTTNGYLLAGYVDVPDQRIEQAGSTTVLSDSADGFISNANLVERGTRLGGEYQGYPTLLVTGEAPDHSFELMLRVVLVGNRLYLVTGGYSSEAGARETERFLSSLDFR